MTSHIPALNKLLSMRSVHGLNGSFTGLHTTKVSASLKKLPPAILAGEHVGLGVLVTPSAVAEFVVNDGEGVEEGNTIVLVIVPLVTATCTTGEQTRLEIC